MISNEISFSDLLHKLKFVPSSKCVGHNPPISIPWNNRTNFYTLRPRSDLSKCRKDFSIDFFAADTDSVKELVFALMMVDYAVIKLAYVGVVTYYS